MLILAPTAKEERDGTVIAATIERIIQQLRLGKVETLYKEAMEVSHWKAPSNRPPLKPGSCAAQKAADVDNYSSAVAGARVRDTNEGTPAVIGPAN